MRAWVYMLSGLLFWAAHFFGVYIIASIFLTSTLSRVLVLALSILLLLADIVLIRHALKRWRRPTGNPLAHWVDQMALMTAALALIAICWQMSPALLA